MQRTTLSVLAAVGITLAAPPVLADDDRPPTAEERTAIEKALRSEGYVSWEDIELDDERWEVDNARTGNGLKYDLELDPQTLKIVRRDRDD